MFIAAAVIGGTLAAGASIYAGSQAANASKEAARVGADAATQSTQIQTDSALAAAKAQADATTEAARIGAASSREAAEVSAAAQREQLNYLREREALPQGLRDDALTRLSGLTGLTSQGTAPQEQVLEAARKSPLYGGILEGREAGEDAILRNASATGGLRSGNTQEALYDYNTRLENQALMTSYGDITGTLQGFAGLPSNANQISNVMSNIGQTRAGGISGAGNAQLTGILGAGNAMTQGMQTAGQAQAQGAYNAGQARALGIQGAGQAWQNGLQGAGNAVMQGLGMHMKYGI
jgi:hypothetical protein